MLRYVLCAPGFFRTFILRVCWSLSNAFLCLLRWSCNFYLYIYYYVLVHVLLCVCWTNLASLEKINLVVGYDLLNVIFNLVCEYSVWVLHLYFSGRLVGNPSWYFCVIIWFCIPELLSFCQMSLVYFSHSILWNNLRNFGLRKSFSVWKKNTFETHD